MPLSLKKLILAPANSPILYLLSYDHTASTTQDTFFCFLNMLSSLSLKAFAHAGPSDGMLFVQKSACILPWLLTDFRSVS